MENRKNPPRGFVAKPFEYGQIVELQIDDITNLGSGVGRIDGWVVMVKFALPKEKVRARVYKNHKNFSEADLVEVLEKSPQRVEAKCPLFMSCGGCQYQHLEYAAQLDWKRKQVGDLMERIGGIRAEVNSPLHTEKIYGYRSKLTPHYEKPRDGKMPVGFVMNGRRNTLVDVPKCEIASDAINAALPLAREEILKKAHSLKRGGTILLRDYGGKVASDNRAIISEKVGNITYKFCAGEFFQNNPFILPHMINFALKNAKGEGIKNLVDAYCGVGVFALAASSMFEKIAGVEVSEPAVKCARENALLNGIKNCEFISGKSEDMFGEVSKNFKGEESAVIIDPPRAGCTQSFIDQLLAFEPKKIVYVSCSPDTQARDLKLILGENYALKCLQPFDLFPHTRHIENIAVLEKIQ